MTHLLKILPKYFSAVVDGRKTFEVRQNDRNFHMGDFVTLLEYDPVGGYTGRVWRGLITYILDDSKYVKDGYVIFSIKEL